MIIKARQDEMRRIAFKWILKDTDEYVVELGCSDGNFAELISKTDIDILELTFKLIR